MREEASNYSLDRQSTWFLKKAQGLVNRYHWAKRSLTWSYHLAVRKRIALDYTRIAPESVPVLISNFNRLDTLRRQVEWLLTLDGHISVIILDNASTYPPLLEFYRALEYPNVQVVDLGVNSCGKGVVHIAKQLTGFPKFIITDPDLLPYPTTPGDVVPHLGRLLDRYPEYNHIGLSLEINDLPDHCAQRERIQRHESQYWHPQARLLNDEVTVAPVDTTFAMYRATSNVQAYEPALRTCRPYTLRHVDWYLDPSNLSEEYRYYLRVCTPYATWATDLKKSLAQGR